MRFLLSCALCALLASPAAAIVYHEDVTLTADDVFPRSEGVGAAPGVTVTIDGAEIWRLGGAGNIVVKPGSIIHEAHFTQRGHWDIQGGDWYAFPQAKNGYFNISGGTFHDRIQFWEGTYEYGSMNISGGTFMGNIAFGEQFEPAGDFHVTVTGGEWLGGGVSLGEGKATIEVFGRYFEQYTVGEFRRVRGILGNGNPFGAGSASDGEDVFTIHADSEHVIPGDGNADGIVDLEDLNDVRNAFGKTSSIPLLGDVDFDFDIDLDDLNLVRNNFGAASNPVPEPSSLGLSLFFATALATKLRRSFRRTSLPLHRQPA